MIAAQAAAAENTAPTWQALATSMLWPVEPWACSA
jgi:hypothetical protein